MYASIFFFLAALAAAGLAVLRDGGMELLVLAGFCGLAGLALFLRTRARRRAAPHDGVVVDGSNVLYWKDDTPRIDTLREVVVALAARGYSVGVVFDANAREVLAGQCGHERDMSRRLGLPLDRIMVVARGTMADPQILAMARELKARVVSNDRFGEWVGTFPEVIALGHVIRGGYRDGALWLDA